MGIPPFLNDGAIIASAVLPFQTENIQKKLKIDHSAAGEYGKCHVIFSYGTALFAPLQGRGTHDLREVPVVAGIAGKPYLQRDIQHGILDVI